LLPILASGFSWAPDIPDIFLPLGISFYSFQIIALQVDVYRRTTEPVSTFSRYALFIAFFPQLIAGPILRGHEFLDQLERGGQMTRERNRRGLWLVASGLTKKVILADFLLAPYVDEIFATPEVGTAPLQLIAIYSFAFQIYFDFSGYSDIARGLAAWFGFELPLNFEEPYLSKDPAEFWRRWHITLSRWLRDYLFVPLSASGDRATTVGALLVTMFLGGLWHGAAWTFALWGVYHGVLLILHRIASPRLQRIAPSGGPARVAWDGLCVFVTFQLVCLGLAIFRAASFSDAKTIYATLFSFDFAAPWPMLQTTLVLLCIALHFAERAVRLRLPKLQAATSDHALGSFGEGLAFGVVIALAIAASGTGGEFIYFQF